MIGTSPHRERGWRRVREGSSLSPALSDEEILTLLMVGRGVSEATTLAQRLVERFGSATAALTTSREALVRIEGLRAADVLRFRALSQVASSFAKRSLDTRPTIYPGRQLAAYLRATTPHLGSYDLRVLFFDRTYRLVRDEVVCRGCLDRAKHYVANPVRRALELSAFNIIAVETYPECRMRPTGAAVERYCALERAARAMDIQLSGYLLLTRACILDLRRDGDSDQVE